ncbi:hypothetical protein GCM10022224_068590 [Nonomuraea antimicrobica]|uniref:Uncharacterized protein n=1 Tax=Nonomuraea antimicrobica TaxID=561173 RepID=A0ABP7CS81_9ACTN
MVLRGLTSAPTLTAGQDRLLGGPNVTGRMDFTPIPGGGVVQIQPRSAAMRAASCRFAAPSLAMAAAR